MFYLATPPDLYRDTIFAMMFIVETPPNEYWPSMPSEKITGLVKLVLKAREKSHLYSSNSL